MQNFSKIQTTVINIGRCVVQNIRAISSLASEIASTIHFGVAPKNFFRRNIVKLHRDQTEIILVGTLHWEHLKHRFLGFGLLRDLINYFSPDQIGIEARPSDLERRLPGLAPIDMVFIWVIAKELCINVYGFDYWQEHQYETIAAQSRTPDYNSSQRNDRMADLLLAQVGTEKKTHLVFTGYSHIKPLKTRLMVQGFRPALLFKVGLDQILHSNKDRSTLPSSLFTELVKAIKYLDSYLKVHQGDNDWLRRVRRKRDRLEDFIRTTNSEII